MRLAVVDFFLGGGAEAFNFGLFLQGVLTRSTQKVNQNTNIFYLSNELGFIVGSILAGGGGQGPLASAPKSTPG